mmetsp:Transcript_135912/g.202120  ORF Transcript_135912/g.202120 Transcript_135912/m.202120 type:complete len:130 (+) Transcript_135912:61-450(+)
MTNTKASSKKKPLLAAKAAKKLRFNTIEIIEFPVGLGDNPSVPDGPPISCCFDNPQRRVTVALELFEEYRPQRRSRKQIRLDRDFREMLLLKRGYSEDEISRASLEARRARFDRMLAVTCPVGLSVLAL